MSILIKGMAMPIDGCHHIICIYADGTVSTSRKEYKAIPVPDHVDLIDRDALWVEINKICNRRDAGIITDLTCLQQLLSAFRHAPTIIPADENSPVYESIKRGLEQAINGESREEETE